MAVYPWGENKSNGRRSIMSMLENHQPDPADESVVRPSFFKFPLALAGHFGYLLTQAMLVFVSLFVLWPLSLFPHVRRRLASAMLRGYLYFFSRYYLPACRACCVEEVSGTMEPPDGGPAIYVANHRSSIDAILLLSMLPPTSLVIKGRHTRKPGYACLVRFFDFVPVTAGAFSRLQKSMDICRGLLASGRNLLIFPEGMRASSTTMLMPFADFTFRLATEKGTPIIPVVLHSDQPFLNREKGSYFPKEIVRFRIRFLESVIPEVAESPGRVADRVSRRMAADITGRAFSDPAEATS
jgi:1-acyl-sn-glycerol-3-phosphate acyltransferase